MEHNYFPQRPTVTPTIYAYRLTGVDSHKGYLKVGYTDRTAKERIDEQLHTSKVIYEIVLVESAMSNDGSCFTDKDVHRLLERKGCKRLNPLDKTDEWFRCSAADVMAAILSLRTGVANEENRTQNFTMRPEQFRAVEQTKTYFEQALKEEPNRIPKFLWNAKKRFGKTFASYQLAKKMGVSRILILTFKPAVESAWREDLVYHIDFEGWQYISNKDARNNNLNIDQEFKRADKSKPIVVFGSFQDLLGTNESGGIKTKNEFIHATNWDLVIFDEYHFGAWKERAKELFEKDSPEMTIVENYVFKRNRSIEHVAPQTPKSNSMMKWDDTPEDKSLRDRFGNLAMISQGLNSSLSNESYEVKTAHVKSYCNGSKSGSIESLKLLIIHRDYPTGWTKDSIEEHGKKMYEWLCNSFKS